MGAVVVTLMAAAAVAAVPPPLPLVRVPAGRPASLNAPAPPAARRAPRSARSKLPSDQRVKWRRDSALQDKGPEGQDLTGGYYDAADYVKFHMPLAFTVSALAIAVIEFPKVRL